MDNDKMKRYIDRQNLVRQDVKREKDGIQLVKKRCESRGIVKEPSKNIGILSSCDVLVVGGGPSGISAALASARVGIDTVIIEKYGCFGGVITTVGMETLAWYRYEGTTDCTGIGIEMERLAAQMGGTIKWPYNDSECLDADFFKVVSDKLIIDAGIRPILHCYAVECIMEDNTIKGIITESKSGRKAILAKRVIDCTGDADVAHLSGAKYNILSTKDRMAVTTVFNCSGINKEKFLEYATKSQKTYNDWGKEWTANSEKEKNLPTPYIQTDQVNGTWSSISDTGDATNLNLVHMHGYDCTNVLDLTAAEIKGRQNTMKSIQSLRENIPGFENAKLRNFAMTLGTRDSRKIIGKYNLTENDVTNQARFDDSIGIFPEFLDGYGVLMLPTTGRYFQVPLGCMIPTDVNNLLVAGRCVAGDKISHSAMRNMMACTVTGQGAGVAAAISVKENVNVADVNIKNVQHELTRQGVTIGNKNLNSKL